MEAESDNFLKALQNRSRNYTKKLDRAKKKQIEVKASGKELKDEERKLIESAPLVEELLQENERVIEQYKKHLQTLQKEEKKPAIKVEEDRSMEVVNLWALVEFLANQQIKDKFIKENSAEQQDLEAFLLLHSQAKGQSGRKLLEILSELEKSVELYLSKSDKVAPGTMKTYKKLSEIGSKYLNWASYQQRPSTPVRTELTVESTPVYSTGVVSEKVEVVEEVKVSSKPEITEKISEDKVEVSEPQAASRWALEEDEEEDFEEETKKEKKEEDEGFTTVTGRKKPTQSRGQETERRQGGRGGRRSGRRGRDRGRG